MKELRWSLLKDERLKRTRGVGFQELVQSRLVGIKDNPRRPGQQLMLFEFYPSRKFTRLYRTGEAK